MVCMGQHVNDSIPGLLHGTNVVQQRLSIGRPWAQLWLGRAAKDVVAVLGLPWVEVSLLGPQISSRMLPCVSVSPA